MMIDQFFTNADYYKNEEFQRLMREWNGLNNYKDCNPEVYEEIVGNLKNEFYRISLEWLKRNCARGKWQFELE
jgi:hypothetical protein